MTGIVEKNFSSQAEIVQGLNNNHRTKQTVRPIEVIYTDEKDEELPGRMAFSLSPANIELLIASTGKSPNDVIKFTFVREGSTEVKHLSLKRQVIRGPRVRMYYEEKPATFYKTT